jgi:hypothetical protein
METEARETLAIPATVDSKNADICVRRFVSQATSFYLRTGTYKRLHRACQNLSPCF